MAVQKVHHHVVDRVGIAHQQLAELLRKPLGIQRIEGKKVKAGLGEGVIHNGVILVAL